jgi:O-Antigen ligase
VPTQTKRVLATSAHWLFALTLIGYPIAGLMAALMNWESKVASIPFRAGVTLLALWVMVRALSHMRSWPVYGWLLLFWMMYLVRLLWDLMVANVPGSSDALVFYLMTVLLPCVALITATTRLDEGQVGSLLIRLGFIVCAMAVLMNLLGLGAESSQAEITTRISYDAINPITLGHAATTTLIAAICSLQTQLGRLRQTGLLFVCSVAVTCLILAGSRGPIISLTACVIIFAFATRRWRWLWLVALLPAILIFNPEGELLNRFTDVSEDGSSLERLAIQGNAVSQFLDYPIFGSAFVELVMLDYPHNLLIETAMALGIVGLFMLLLVLLKTGLLAVRQIRKGEFLFVLLFVQYFIGAQFSGSIYGSSGLWATTVVLLGLKYRKKTMPFLTGKKAI